VGVPREARRVRGSIALPRAVWEDVDFAATLHGISRSQVIAGVLMSAGFDGPGVSGMVERIEARTARRNDEREIARSVVGDGFEGTAGELDEALKTAGVSVGRARIVRGEVTISERVAGARNARRWVMRAEVHPVGVWSGDDDDGRLHDTAYRRDGDCGDVDAR
ncbi:MAG: hypothetical protein KGS10_18650, partial [Chloroflexi bacterium]|nr:hypothetical protein [Chloroflexota bacterium]